MKFLKYLESCLFYLLRKKKSKRKILDLSNHPFKSEYIIYTLSIYKNQTLDKIKLCKCELSNATATKIIKYLPHSVKTLDLSDNNIGLQTSPKNSTLTQFCNLVVNHPNLDTLIIKNNYFSTKEKQLLSTQKNLKCIFENEIPKHPSTIRPQKTIKKTLTWAKNLQTIYRYPDATPPSPKVLKNNYTPFEF